jgi:hypothetical protein
MPSRGRDVDAVGVRGRSLVLSGEACRGVGSRDDDPPDGGGREAAAHPAGVSRGRSARRAGRVASWWKSSRTDPKRGP